MSKEELILTLRVRYAMSIYNRTIPFIIDDMRRCCERLSYQEAHGFPFFCSCPHRCPGNCSCSECWEEAITKFLSSGDVDVSL